MNQAPVNETVNDSAAALAPVPAPVAGRLHLPEQNIPTFDAAARPPMPEELLFPDLHDEKAKAEAYAAIVRDGMTLSEAAAKAGICERTVKLWAARGRWLRLAEEMLAVEETDEAHRLRRLRLEKREDAIDAQAEVGKKICKEASDQLGTELSPQGLAWVAAAAKAGAEIASRALGINADGAVVGTAEAAASASAKTAAAQQPLVVVVQGGGLPPLRRAEAGA